MKPVEILHAEAESRGGRPLLALALAVAAGAIVDRYAVSPHGAEGLRAWWLAATGLLIASIVMRRSGWRRREPAVLLICLACVAGGWHHVRWNYTAADDLGRFARKIDEPVCLEGIVTRRMKWSPPPEVTPLRAIPTGSRSETSVRITRLRDGVQWRPASGRSRLLISGDVTHIGSGDHVRIFARMRKPTPALNPGQYDWSLAERASGRFSQLFCRAPECVTVLRPAPRGSLSYWLERTRNWCEGWLARYVGPEQTDLALAVTLGARERLDNRTTELFLQTGTIHLLVVSGLHVGLMAMIIWWTISAGLFSRRTGVVLTIVLIVAYAVLTGGRPPVIRATILVISLLVSMSIGRRISGPNVLAAAGLVVMAYNPCELFRPGTQLSFLSVGALMAYGNFLLRRRTFDPLQLLVEEEMSWHEKIVRWTTYRLRDLTCASIVVWLVTTPLVAYSFHTSAPISVLVTPLAWPLIAVALGSALLTWTVGWLMPPVAVIAGAVVAGSLLTVRRLMEFAQQLDIGHMYTGGPPLWWVVGFYSALGFFLIFARYRPPLKWQLAAAALWVAIGFATATHQSKEERLQCTFLAMGHGTCVVLELPGGQTVLYDAGSLGAPRSATQTVASFLWSRGINHIDAIVLSHADVDHYNAVPGLLDRFSVGTVYVSPMMFDPLATDGQLNAPNHLRARLAEAEVPLEEIWTNDRLLVADRRVQIEVFHPPRIGVIGRDNANSIVLLVTYQGRSILLPGDLEELGLEAVLEEPPPDCDILLAPHHGSSNSDPPEFAAWSHPDWVVISGRGNLQQSTTASYRQVGAQVLQTSRCGAVRFTLTGQAISASTFLENLAP